jgi:hypothetical protein
MKTCECCGQEFTPYRTQSKQRFCSRLCQNRVRRRRDRAKKRPPMPEACIVCGGELPKVRKVTRRVCSKVCMSRMEQWERRDKPRPGAKVHWQPTPRIAITGVVLTRTIHTAIVLASGTMYEVQPKQLQVI